MVVGSWNDVSSLPCSPGHRVSRTSTQLTSPVKKLPHVLTKNPLWVPLNITQGPIYGLHNKYCLHNEYEYGAGQRRRLSSTSHVKVGPTYLPRDVMSLSAVKISASWGVKNVALQLLSMTITCQYRIQGE